MADIVYCYNHEVYFNLTNKCPCNCTFCIRNNGEERKHFERQFLSVL